MTRVALAIFGILALLGTMPLIASPVSPGAALVAFDLERDGQRLFAPRLLVKLGEMSEASMELPSGKAHRIVLSVTRDKDFYRLRSLYLTKEADRRWVVQAEPAMAFVGDAPASVTLADDAGESQLHLSVSVGQATELRAALPGFAGDQTGE